MALHAEPSDLLVAVTEFRAALEMLGITSRHAARLFAVNERSARRWRDGSRHVPHGIGIVCRLLIAKVVTVDQVEQAVAPVPARINGRAEPEPPAPLRAASAPEAQSLAPQRAKTATLADSSSATAEKVLALVEGTCRWPHNDPRDCDFHFCEAPVIVMPYCPHHRALAYLAPRPSRGHGFRIGSVAHGRLPASVHDRPSTSSALSAAGAARAPTSRATFPDSTQPPA
jgi:hypothetical protein